MGRGEGSETRGGRRRAVLRLWAAGLVGVFVGRLEIMGMDDTKRFSVDDDRAL